MSSCAYANILGEPGKGVHSSRIGPFALADTIATIIAAIVTSMIFKIPLLYSFVGWFVAGEILHYIFGVDSAFLEYIGMTPKCD
jgi:hypothetical protein